MGWREILIILTTISSKLLPNGLIDSVFFYSGDDLAPNSGKLSPNQYSSRSLNQFDVDKPQWVGRNDTSILALVLVFRVVLEHPYI